MSISAINVPHAVCVTFGKGHRHQITTSTGTVELDHNAVALIPCQSEGTGYASVHLLFGGEFERYYTGAEALRLDLSLYSRGYVKCPDPIDLPTPLDQLSGSDCRTRSTDR